MNRLRFYKPLFVKIQELAPQKEELAKICQELYSLRWFLNDNYPIKFYMDNNIYSVAQKEKTLFFILDKLSPNCPALSIVFLLFLLKHKCFHELGYAINLFKYFLEQEYNITLVEVISRYDVNKPLLTKLSCHIKDTCCQDVGYIYKKVDTLLGGYKLRWANGEIDFSVKKYVDLLHNEITTRKVICKNDK